MIEGLARVVGLVNERASAQLVASEWGRLWEPMNPVDKSRIARHAPAGVKFIRDLKARSMLHYQTLALMRFFAQQASSAILEIGPYMGGSTIALAAGVKASGRSVPIITIEVGGKHDNPYLPSPDILGDLRRNLRAYGMAGRVAIVEGFSWEATTITRVERLLAGRRADIFAVDSDGAIARDFQLYRRFLTDDALLIIDDYREATGLKSGPVQAFVAQLLASGQATDLGIYEWGTWFGRLKREGRS